MVLQILIYDPADGLSQPHAVVGAPAFGADRQGVGHVVIGSLIVKQPIDSLRHKAQMGLRFVLAHGLVQKPDPNDGTDQCNAQQPDKATPVGSNLLE